MHVGFLRRAIDDRREKHVETRDVRVERTSPGTRSDITPVRRHSARSHRSSITRAMIQRGSRPNSRHIFEPGHSYMYVHEPLPLSNTRDTCRRHILEWLRLEARIQRPRVACTRRTNAEELAAARTLLSRPKSWAALLAAARRYSSSVTPSSLPSTGPARLAVEHVTNSLD